MPLKKTRTILTLLGLTLFGIVPSCYAIDENDVSQMLSQFKAKGIISEKDLANAQAKLGDISPEKWKKINAYANTQMESKGHTPSSNNVDEAAANIDTNSVEFQKTMADMKKIMIDK